MRTKRLFGIWVWKEDDGLIVVHFAHIQNGHETGVYYTPSQGLLNWLGRLVHLHPAVHPILIGDSFGFQVCLA